MHLFRFVPDFSARREPGVDPVSSAAGETYLIRASGGPVLPALQAGHLAIYTALIGQLGLNVGGRVVIVEPGHYAVINAGLTTWILPAPITHGRFLGLAIHPDRVAGVQRSTGAQPGEIFFEEVRAHDKFVSPHLLAVDRALAMVGVPRRQIESRIAQIIEALVQRNAETRARIAIIPKRRSTTREEIYRQVQRARQMMDNSYAELHTVDPVARVASMSYAHFHRCFAQIVGVTPYRYLTEQRLTVALRDLRETGRSIRLISLALGFGNQSSFNALFRRRFGLTPGEYRAGTDIPASHRHAPRGRQPRTWPRSRNRSPNVRPLAVA